MLAKHFAPRRSLSLPKLTTIPKTATFRSARPPSLLSKRSFSNFRPATLMVSFNVMRSTPPLVTALKKSHIVSPFITLAPFVRHFVNEREDLDMQSRDQRRERREGGFQRQSRGPRVGTQAASPVLLVRGLTADKATEAGVRKLFDGLDIATDGIKILKDASGKLLGPIFVEFVSGEEAGKAFRGIRTRTDPEETPVALRPSSAEERSAAVVQAVKPSSTVFIKRIPYSASPEDIKTLFTGLNITSLSVGNGIAVVTFANSQDAAQALTKTGTDFQKRSIFVEPAFQFDYDYAVARPIKIVRIRGAPATATDEDFHNFFKGLEVTRVNITTREGISGRQVPGDVFVEFSNHDQLLQALKMDRQSMGERYLQIYRSSGRERKNRLEGNMRFAPRGSSESAGEHVGEPTEDEKMNQLRV